MMDVPQEVVEQFKCSECDMYLSRGPVYLWHDGAAVYGGCFSPTRPAKRNTPYETIASLVRFPCRNRELGCRETVGFAAEGQEVAHETTCEYRPYVCPVLGSARCDWLGPRSQILQHCRAQHPDLETCAECGALVTVKLYRDAGGWRCERCVPARRACKDQARGCNHQDIPSKCSKHEWYFCQQGTWCLICGTAVCEYWLGDSELVLYVYIPVVSERLCEFRCEVRVTHPTTRLTRTYTPDVTYNDTEDWSIKICKEDLASWNEEFDICVNIIKN